MIVEAGIWISLLCYLAGWSAQFSKFQSTVNIPELSGLRILQAGCIIHFAAICYFFYKHSWPETLISDFLNLIAWIPIFLHLLTRKYITSKISTTVIPPFSIVLLLISYLLHAQSIPTLELIREAPLLNQTLLITHISALIAGYVLFGFSCISSIIFLYQDHQIKTKLVKLLVNQFPSLSTLDQTSYKSIIMGFFFLTIGLILGIILSIDLQSSRSILRLGFSILIWLLYAFFLMERFFQGYQRRFSAIWSVIGFFLVLMSLIIESMYLA
ncbi:MAG: cytochrome c biogenesis protein CcsA [SAR324 cluster bacterium]|nr:cytochrome c biogenesis protein CcsA [SAR324 cluster bacterium]